MTRLVLAFIRFAALALSFCLSTMVAAIFLTFVLFLGSDLGWVKEDILAAVGAIGFAVGMWVTAAQLSFAPAALILVVMEFSRLGSLLWNMLAGGLCALAVLLLNPMDPNKGTTLPYEQNEIWLAVIASGFIGGLAHWMLAGYRAGRWLGPQQSADL